MFVRLLPIITSILLLGACSSTANSSANLFGFGAVGDTGKAKQITRHGLLKYQNGDMENAAAYAEVSLSIDPKNVVARQLAAKTALINGDWKEANEHLYHLPTEALDAEMLGLLGVAYLEQGKVEEARPMLETALLAEPDNWRLALALSEIEYRADNLDAAQSYLERARINSEFKPYMDVQQGNIEFARANYDSALRYFELALRETDGELGDSLNYRLALAQTGRLSQALEGADSERRGLIFRELGRIAIADKRKFDAVRYLKQAQSLFPKHDDETEGLLGDALAIDGIS